MAAGYYYAVKELAIENGDKTFYRMAQRLKITDSRARQLWNGVRSMKDDTVTMILDGYEVGPEILLRRRPDPSKSAPAKSARRPARKSRARPKVT